MVGLAKEQNRSLSNLIDCVLQNFVEKEVSDDRPETD
jgi:hypothetical protein